MADEDQAAGTAVEKVKKEKKLSKIIEGTVLTIKEKVTGFVGQFDFASLPADIQAKLGPYGLSQKLGDAAAGKEGQEAVDAINKVWEGLTKGDFTVRVPAADKGPKLNDMLAKYQAMPEGKQKQVVGEYLKSIGALKE